MHGLQDGGRARREPMAGWAALAAGPQLLDYGPPAALAVHPPDRASTTVPPNFNLMRPSQAGPECVRAWL